MTKRENRRFLQRQILEMERLEPFTKGHPLMGPQHAERTQALRDELAQLPAGGAEARTVLFFSGKPVYGSTGIDAKFATDVLSPFLEMVKTEYSATKHGRVGERGPRRDEDEARLLLTGMPRGSFGLELSEGPSDDLFTEEHLSSVLVRVTELLASAGKTDEDFVHALDRVSPRVYSRVRDFFTALDSNHASIRMQTGDLEFQLDQSAIAQALGRAISIQTVDDEIDVPGVFRGATLDTWRFDFHSDGGDTLNGRLSEALTEAQVVQMLSLTTKPCIAHMKRTRTTTSSGIVRTRYELLDLSARDQQPSAVVAQS